jgi:hypothetical protein
LETKKRINLYLLDVGCSWNRKTNWYEFHSNFLNDTMTRGYLIGSKVDKQFVTHEYSITVDAFSQGTISKNTCALGGGGGIFRIERVFFGLTRRYMHPMQTSNNAVIIKGRYCRKVPTISFSSCTGGFKLESFFTAAAELLLFEGGLERGQKLGRTTGCCCGAFVGAATTVTFRKAGALDGGGELEKGLLLENRTDGFVGICIGEPLDRVAG